ncbi:glycoside hydrolase family 44 protein, partial [Staphylococcus borealis]
MPIIVDAAADVHPISPLIYGISFASPAVQRDLRLALVRSGGNSASLYDWRDEARGAGRDWFFESLPIAADDPAQYGARFVAQARAGGAAPMLTVPMTGWAASLGPGGGKRAAFAIDRYGEQAASDRDGF